jgi:hypothetical protein
MYDGSKDDYIDGNLLAHQSCCQQQFSQTELKWLSLHNYLTVISILGEYNDDQDLSLQFPLTVKLSNYTEVRAENQADYNAILQASSQRLQVKMLFLQ